MKSIKINRKEKTVTIIWETETIIKYSCFSMFRTYLRVVTMEKTQIDIWIDKKDEFKINNRIIQ